MFATLLGYLDSAMISGAICLVAGVIFSQKIKDFITGVPAGFRSAMTSVEAKAKADVQSAIADVFSKLTPVATKAPAPPPAPVVQAAPAPDAPKVG